MPVFLVIRSYRAQLRSCCFIALGPRMPASAVGAAALRIGLSADVTTMDPHFVAAQPNLTVQEHIFDGLVGIDERGRVVPGIAASWTTPDPLTWEIKLRPGVKFHDGSELTAEDVVFSLERPLGIKRVVPAVCDARAAHNGEADRRPAHAAAEDGHAVRAPPAGPRARADRLQARGRARKRRGFRQRQSRDRHRTFQAGEIRARGQLLFTDCLFPRNMSLNWFIPALVNISVGSFLITIGADGTIR